MLYPTLAPPPSPPVSSSSSQKQEGKGCKLVISSSQPNLHIILFALVLALSTFNLGHGDKNTQPLSGAILSAQSASSSPGSVVPTISTTPEPEDNGDDGPALRKDIENEAKNTSIPEDKHLFYKPEYYINDTAKAMSFWVDFSKLSLSQHNISTKHDMLSKSHRRAAPIKLSFDFPFYGQPLRNIIIATGGFLYVGEHLHHWLAATQNISPLMANFDLSTSNSSDIHYYDNGTALVVQWQNVQMKDNKPPGDFSFQVTLHKNGDIVFVYKSLPVPIKDIPEDEHPVKVGISDAFLIDKVAFFIRRKTIYDYHRLNLKDDTGPETKIGNQTAIYLKALPTCNQYDSCEDCSKAAPNLECIWCPAVKRCSNGYDRKRQEWLTNNCDKVTRSDCSKSNNQPQPSSSSPPISVDSPSTGRQMMGPNGRATPEPRTSEGGTAFVSFLMLMALTSGVALWVFYAYKNPHTPSGQMLIKYRPSNWRWQNAETRYTAASIHM